jgi:hypothetical protein
MLLNLTKQVYGQTEIPRDTISSLYNYEGVVTADSITKQQLYTNAKNWILKTLKSNDNIVNLDDKEYNSITGSGTILLEDRIGNAGVTYSNTKLNFKITIQFKEGKYKYSFVNFTYSAEKRLGNYNGTVVVPLEGLDIGKKATALVLKDVSMKMKILVESLIAANSKASQKAKDNW